MPISFVMTCQSIIFIAYIAPFILTDGEVQVTGKIIEQRTIMDLAEKTIYGQRYFCTELFRQAAKNLTPRATI